MASKFSKEYLQTNMASATHSHQDLEETEKNQWQQDQKKSDKFLLQ